MTAYAGHTWTNGSGTAINGPHLQEIDDAVVDHDTRIAGLEEGDGSATPDATGSTKGKVQLAGDLGGTAAAPTVPALAGKAPLNVPVRAVSANTTAVAGETLAVDATAGARIITPPASPATGARVTVIKVDGSANIVTWDGPTNSDSNALLVSQWAGGTFVWDGTRWVVQSVNVASGATYTDEQVRDVVAATLVQGANVTITPNDGADTITIAATGGGGGSTDSNVLAVGEETISRRLTNSSALQSSSGSLRLTYFTARTSTVLTQVRVRTGGTAAGATPTLIRVGLYLLDPTTGAGTLVASTPSDTTLLATMGVAYTKAFSAPYTLIAGQRYALGVLVVTSAAAPTLCGYAGPGSILGEFDVAPRLCGTLTAQTDLPSGFTNAALSSSTNLYYAALLP